MTRFAAQIQGQCVDCPRSAMGDSQRFRCPPSPFGASRVPRISLLRCGRQHLNPVIPSRVPHLSILRCGKAQTSTHLFSTRHIPGVPHPWRSFIAARVGKQEPQLCHPKPGASHLAFEMWESTNVNPPLFNETHPGGAPSLAQLHRGKGGKAGTSPVLVSGMKIILVVDSLTEQRAQPCHPECSTATAVTPRAGRPCHRTTEAEGSALEIAASLYRRPPGRL